MFKKELAYFLNDFKQKMLVCNRKCHSETRHREVNKGKIMHLFMSCGISGKTGHFCQRQCVCNLRRYSRLTSYPLPDPPIPPSVSQWGQTEPEVSGRSMSVCLLQG